MYYDEIFQYMTRSSNIYNVYRKTPTDFTNHTIL